MFKILFVLFSVMFSAQVLAENKVVKTPVYEQVQVCQEKSSAVSTGVGIGAGYLAGRLLFGKKGVGKYAGAAAGGVIGSQVGKDKICHPEQKLIGYQIITVNGNQVTEVFEPLTQ